MGSLGRKFAACAGQRIVYILETVRHPTHVFLAYAPSLARGRIYFVDLGVH